MAPSPNPTRLTSLNSTVFLAWLRRAGEVFAVEASRLTALDSAIGDGDHGANLARGFGAVVTKMVAWQEAEPGALFKNVAMTLIGTVGGASGPLYGSFFLDASKAIGADHELDLAAWTQVFAAGLTGIQNRGKAALGDKTMLDALTPAKQALEAAAGTDLITALNNAADAAAQGAEATGPLVARKGRASYLGERSAGHLDPGAVSSSLLLAALAHAAETAA